VFGDYLLYEEEGHAQPFVITEGFSRDHRPDLKQLTHNLLCVDHGIPVYSKIMDGNASKTIHHRLIPEMAQRMRSLGREVFIYVADSALVTEENLALIDDWDNGFLFVSRLPLTYNECHHAIEQAVEADAWQAIGVISDEPETKNRKPASYRCFETVVTLYGITYRALVAHSDAYDERRQKKVDKQIVKEQEDLTKLKKGLEKIEYACLPDAEAAMKRISPAQFHQLTIAIEPRPQYHKGRPKTDGTRRLKSMRYGLKISIEPYQEAVDRLRHEAGCFVPIGNTLAMGTVFVNALFLKSPRRIEALGLILVLALLIWRLMERTMRLNLRTSRSTITGWEKRQTSRPTSLMLTTKFVGIFVLVSSLQRRLAQPLNPVQLRYLKILELTPEIFLNPCGRHHHAKQRE